MRLSTKVYKNKKQGFIKKMKMSEKSYNDIISDDFDTGTERCYKRGLLAACIGGKMPTTIPEVELFEFLWYYKRNFHVITSDTNKECLDSIDTTLLDKLDTDMEIDTSIDGEEFYIHFARRIYPIYCEGIKCKYSVTVYNHSTKAARFHFALSNECSKVYLEQRGSAIKYYGVIGSVQKAFSELSLSDEIIVSDSSFKTPDKYLQIVLYVANKYISREKLTRKKLSTNSETDRNLMVVRKEVDSDTERLMLMNEYEYTYRESIRSEYKGGHHASPVSHQRSGYFRKSRSGDHVIVDGKFVKVPKGTGQYTYVRPTLVNAHNDSTIGNIL